MNKVLLFLSLLVLTVSVSYGQGRTVAGKVTTNDGEGLPGVSIVVKGTTIGTVTDVNGAYSLSVPNDDAVLTFTSIGYTPEEVTVGAQTAIDIKLVEDVSTLSEVVVVGYGEQKKSLVTGAISSVKAAELKNVSVSRVDQALQGRTSGVNITPNSGSPGAGTKIQIRGMSSNGASDPLFIIDGVRTGSAGMDYLNPADIASIEVLKDAASAAIYGAEGANGVIIITTKSGKAGTSEITYSGQMAGQDVRPNVLPVMNASQYQQYLTEANVAGRPTKADIPRNAAGDTLAGTNWQDEIFRFARQQNHNINFSGGTEKSTLFISAGYFSQEGIVGGDKSKFERYNARVNSTHKLKNWLTVGQNFSYSNTVRGGISQDNTFGGVLANAIGYDPITPVRYNGAGVPAHAAPGATAGQIALDPNGNAYGISKYVVGEFSNPVFQIEREHEKSIQNKILGNVFLDIAPFKGFKFTTRAGVDAAFQHRHDWEHVAWWNATNLRTIAGGSDNWEQWYTWQWENFASYNKSFGDHQITVLGGISAQKYTNNQLNGSYQGLFRESDDFSYAEYVSDEQDLIGGRPEYRSLHSYFGRLSYDFKGKYLIEATLRRDGSSMLADGEQWGTFPSISAGWVLSNEAFFPAALSNAVSYAKIRGSWGQNGSLSNITPGRWQSTVNGNDRTRAIRYPGSGAYVQGAAPIRMVNPNLTWETSEQLDFGVDLRFLNNRLGLTADWFNKKTIDLITEGTPPGITGLTLPSVNSGSVSNKGLELELSYKNRDDQAFKYEVSGNFTTIKNEVTAIAPGGQAPGGANIGTSWTNATVFEVGEPIWSFRGFKTAGIFNDPGELEAYKLRHPSTTPYGTAGPQLGDPIVVNVNNDSAITTDDFTIIGNPHPKFYYGGRVYMSYKGFDFTFFIQGRGGNDIALGFNRTDYGGANKPLFFFEDRWTAENGTNDWFRASTNGVAYSSDFMIFDGSYARVRQLQLGYTLPTIATNFLRIKSARVYFTLDNYFTFTKYPGLDPEAGSNNINSIGIDRAVYPIPRTVAGGLSFTF